MIKRLKFFFCFLFLVESRTFIPKFVQFHWMIFKPIPSLLKSSFISLPTAAISFKTHALSGATTEVKSSLGNSISIEAGEDLSFQFYTFRYSAQSFKVTGLPEGLNLQTSSGFGTISGNVTEPGTYDIEIIGYRYANLSGSNTPTFNLNLQITENSEVSLDRFFSPEKTTDHGASWFTSSWFGTFHRLEASNWVYHRVLKWVYLHPDQPDSLWLFDADLGWLYTSENLYPYFYKHDGGTWIYQLPNPSPHRFWDYANQTKIL